MMMMMMMMMTTTTTMTSTKRMCAEVQVRTIVSGGLITTFVSSYATTAVPHAGVLEAVITKTWFSYEEYKDRSVTSIPPTGCLASLAPSLRVPLLFPSLPLSLLSRSLSPFSMLGLEVSILIMTTTMRITTILMVKGR
jgi:hypothetical protein